MDIIPSIFIQKMQGMEPNEIARKFDFFKDDLPHPGSLIAELLQWQVRYKSVAARLIINWLSYTYDSVFLPSLKTTIFVLVDILEECTCCANNTADGIKTIKQSNVSKHPNNCQDHVDLSSYNIYLWKGISVLNRVKSFNRTTQADERLTGLCIICRT